MNGQLCSHKMESHWNQSQRRIGLTGGIASGKSSVGEYLKDNKALPIIDADLYARQALAPESIYTKIVIERYGKAICTEAPSSINRSALSKIIFSDAEEKQWLENLLHPIIRKNIKKEISKHSHSKIVVLIIPLLFETNFSELCNETWLVYCNPEQQLKRLMVRNNINKDDASAIIKTQLPLDIKKKLADHVIFNNGKPGDWINEVDLLLN